MNDKIKDLQSAAIGKKPWFLGLRILTTLFLLGSSLVFLNPITFNYALLIIYSSLTLILLLHNLIGIRYSESFVRSLLIVQIACELIIEGLLVNHVGANFSPFILFFLITIVTAGLLFHLMGSIIVATLAGLLYSMPIFFDLSAIFQGLLEATRLTGMGVSSDEAFYTVFLHLCLFYFFAFISGYMTERLFFTSQELNKVRLETNEIIEQMISGLMTVDANGRIIYFNNAAGEIFGINPESARGGNINDIFSDGLKDFLIKIRIALETGQHETRGEVQVRLPDRGIIPIGLSFSPLKDGSGILRGVIAIFQDLSEAKKLDARIRASERLAAVGRLAAGIAHEIRNPLASISGSVEVLKDELQPTGDNLRLMQLILKESSRLNTILTDFLNFSRVSKTSSSKCDLVSVISEVIGLVKVNHQVNDSILISSNIHRQPIIVSGSEDQLKQILWNLILNSAQALGASGQIKISTADSLEIGRPKMVKLIVSDTGSGIPEGLMDKIFDPFFSTKQDGTGLGLSIVARIIDCLDGKIEVESSSDNGTKFSIFLPLAASNEKKSIVLQEVGSG